MTKYVLHIKFTFIITVVYTLKLPNLVNMEAATSNMNKSGYYEGYITHNKILETCKNLK